MEATFSELLDGPLARGGRSYLFTCRIVAELPTLAKPPNRGGLTIQIVGGSIEWEYLGVREDVRRGLIYFFGTADAPQEARSIVYRLTFSSNGTDYEFVGTKRLVPRLEPDVAMDLTQVYATINVAGQPFASGVLISPLDDLLRALGGVVAQAEAPTAHASLPFTMFDEFLNRQLTEIYPHLPPLFIAGGRTLDGLKNSLRILTEVLLPDPLPSDGPSVDDVISGIDRFLQHASGQQVQQVRLLLQIASVFVPILEHEIEKIRRKVRDVFADETNSLIRRALTGMHQVVVFAYYASQNADCLLGYTRPIHQPRHNTDLTVSPRIPNRVFDVAIAGTGPAGALLAERLSARGKSVLLLETGAYIPERAITPDELDSIGRLYKNSGLQATKDPSSITVLQGSCVGGGGVINNGIFFPLAQATLDVWRDVGFPFAAETMGEAYQVVARDLDIGDIASKAVRLNPAGMFLEHKFGTLQSPPIGPVPPGFYRTMVNLETRDNGGHTVGCLSTGLCNLGCGSERKVNSFQRYLKGALDGTRDVVLVPRAMVVRAVMANRADVRRVTALQVRMADGSIALARAESFVLCCGAVGSSAVLLRSKELLEAAEAGLPVGKRFCGNVASPLFAVAPHIVNAETSVQMCHVLVPTPGDDGFLLETWFSPPGGLALAMPGFLEAHAERMRLYPQLMSAAPVIGTQPSGTITTKGLEAVMDLPLWPVDIERFRRGMILLVRAFLETAGPVIVRLGNGRVITSARDVDALDAELARITPKDLYLLPMSTAHPQGGNALSEDAAIGVVGSDFRLRGIDNLRVCDGSVFPSVAGVNPQWTIFALAHLCSMTFD